MPAQNDETDTSARIEHRLNEYGHGFHFAVMQQAANLPSQGSVPNWQLLGTEIPVVTRGALTHIDFILVQDKEMPGYQLKTFLVAECKRVNNGYSRWCFVRRPFPAVENLLVFEEFNVRELQGHTNLLIRRHTFSKRHDSAVYGIELEVMLKKSEDPNKSPIKDTVAQVLRGMNGLINLQLRKPNSMNGSTTVLRFIPAIFTTANLWVSDVDLQTANIETGNVGQANSKKTEWLWFNHNQSPMLKHDFQGDQTSSISKEFEVEFSRSIAIVNASGIEQFLLSTLNFFRDQ